MDCVIPLIVFLIILTIVVFGIVCVCKKTENFSPTGFTQNCPRGKGLISPNMAVGEPWRKTGFVKLDNGKIAGSQSPGSVFLCDDVENCPNLTISGCDNRKENVILKENIPLGWGSTMTGPYAGNNCMSNVNGVNKPSMRNPYGKLYPEGDQMYSFCEPGTPNAFAN